MATLGDLEALKKLKAEQEKAQKEFNKARASANKGKVGSLPKTKQKQVEAAKKKLDAKKEKVKRTEDFIRKNREQAEARKKAKSLAEGKKQFEASKAKAKARAKTATKPSPSDSAFEKKKRMIEKNRERAPIRERAAKARAANPAKVTSRTTTAKPLPKPSPTVPAKQATTQAAKQIGRRSALRAIPAIGTALTAAELGGAATEKVLQNRAEQEAYNEAVRQGKAQVREGKRVQPEGGFTGSGNLARQIIENQRRGRPTRVPESEGLQRSEQYIPKYSEAELRATDSEPKEEFDTFSFEGISKAVTGDPYAFARLGRETIEEQATQALEEGTIKPENVGQQAVNNEIQKRKSEGTGTITQEEATKIKADTEREFKEASFDGKKALLGILGVAAMAYSFKEDPVGSINAISSKLDAREQAKLEAAAQEAQRKFKAEENEKDRQTDLEIANMRLKGAAEVAAVKARAKDALESQAISLSDAEDFVARWAEENEVDITPDKLSALAQQYRNISSKNPKMVGADPSVVLGKLVQGRITKQPTTLGFTPFTGEYKFN